MHLLVPHIDEVKASLGEAAIQALSIVFDNSNGNKVLNRAKCQNNNDLMRTVYQAVNQNRFFGHGQRI
ncbi:MAG: hypothetical protein B7Y56_09815 [Gallionellales bacterium 35-53-114]|jgi:hypothetical protein|nr:MAG: hypothetical protein B7Y56_09815 [Gallionellales bacterium 35-53-114]OYZ62913.1 MAG: hypothetical protein B7Y04_13670 [Gallionellales bacterium 24-53-125]OZB09991.1 MAG: hypothetical protein B7X61_05575 [Gallionellales bacterium 39-52-133]HQS58338.1 hypothetical protein [Gallionellaceae bacterium]HQS73893.1 hypothetical protein [Gallionellaceae bacterium]